MTLRIGCYLLVCAAALRSQGVDLRHLHERMLAVVPLTGAGTYADPRRPLFAPSSTREGGESGILSYEWAPSDDGQFAIVEFVAKDRSALAKIATDARVLRAFEKGKVKKDDVEKELKKYRKDFKFEKKEGGRP
jgi:hypothetical protein